MDNTPGERLDKPAALYNPNAHQNASNIDTTPGQKLNEPAGLYNPNAHQDTSNMDTTPGQSLDNPVEMAASDENQDLMARCQSMQRFANFMIMMNLFMSFVDLSLVVYEIFVGPLSNKLVTCPLKEENNLGHLISSIPFVVSWIVLYFGRYFYGAKKVATLPQTYNADDLVECMESTFRNLEVGLNNNKNWQPNKATQSSMQAFATFVMNPTTPGLYACNRSLYLSFFASNLAFVVHLAVEMFYERCNHQASAMTIFLTGAQLGMLVNAAWTGYRAGWGSKMRLHAQRIRAKMHTGGTSKEDGNSRSVEWWHQQLTRRVLEERKVEQV